MSAVARLSTGSVLGRYQILRRIASGGMAEVHLARTTGVGGFERYVVVKTILPENAGDPRFVTMFLDEARLAAQLHHQNIVQVHDVGEDGGTFYIAMEYVHGHSVHAVMLAAADRGDHVPIEHVLAIVAGAAAGLDYAHAKRGPDLGPLDLIHRDVSPSNLLVAYDGTVKLVDFGVARATTRTTHTRSGLIKGKLAYMSPEQCRAREIDRRSDIFSLGVVFHELLALRRVFHFESDYDAMQAIVAGEVPPPSLLRGDVPADVDAIVARCLEKDPAARWQTAGALLEAIEACARGHGYVLTSRNLQRYMTEQFGDQIEPWLDQDRIETAIREPVAIAPRAVSAAMLPSSAIVLLSSSADAKPAAAARAMSDAPQTRTAPRWWLALPIAVVVGGGGALAIGLAGDDGVPQPVAAPPDAAVTTTPPPPPPSPVDAAVVTLDPPAGADAETARRDPSPRRPRTPREPPPQIDRRPSPDAALVPERDPSTLLPPSQRP